MCPAHIPLLFGMGCAKSPAALYDIAAIEAPAAFFELAPYPDGIRLFVSEFILDIEDLMNDYEYEEHEAGN